MCHNILVDNVINGETIIHRLLIVKGRVARDPQCIKKPLDFRINNQLFLIKDDQGECFKSMVCLIEGLNIIKLSTDCCTLNLSVIYEPKFATDAFTVLPLYIINDGHDGRFNAVDHQNKPSDACERINVSAELLQCAISEKMLEMFGQRKTFTLEPTQIFRSKLKCEEARNTDQKTLWKMIGRELLQSTFEGTFAKRRKYMGFLSCSRYNGYAYNETMESFEQLNQLAEGYIALGGGDLALFGSLCLFAWPQTYDDIYRSFLDENKIDRKMFLDDSCYRRTFGACFSTTLGSVLHELCHTFDLGHTSSGIMGRGFDDIYKMFTVVCKPGRSIQAIQHNIDGSNRIIIRKLETFDNTSLDDSCATILFYHRWLNGSLQDNKKFVLTYDNNNQVLTSTAGIRAIEIRTFDDEMVENSWTFNGKVRKFSFRLPISKPAEESRIVLAIDNSGNILKQNIHVVETK